MEVSDNKKSNVPPASSSELTGMQSVRATFKLSKRTIKTINVVAAQLGIRQKSLFDHLMEDPESLEAVADEVKQTSPEVPEGVYKTYVVSRKSLTVLEKVCKTRKAHRDMLIEYSVQRLKPIIDREREKQTKRKEILSEFRQMVHREQQLLEKAGDLLDADDLVLNRLASAIANSVTAYQHMAEFVKKGEDLEALRHT